MSTSLIQPLMQFMLWFAVASTISMVCWGLTRLLDTNPAGCTGVANFAGFISLVFLVGVYFYIGIFVFIPICLAALFCAPAAFAQKALNHNRTSTLTHYLSLLVADLLGIAVGFVFIFSELVQLDFLEALGFLLGLVTMPAAIPLSRWIWRSSKTRPGIDRHLDSSEETIQP